MGRCKTYLQLENKSGKTLRTEVSRVDCYDWEGQNRPDRNFHNLNIRPRQLVTKPLDLNTWASSNMYNIDLVFEDGKRLTCRIDQGIASGRKESFGEYIPNVIKDTLLSIPGATVAAGGITAATDAVYNGISHAERGSQYVEGDTDFYRALITTDGNNVTITVVPTPL